MEIMLKIKRIALANGDEYEDCRADVNIDDFLEAIKEREFINILIGTCNKGVLINSDYIISLEI